MEGLSWVWGALVLKNNQHLYHADDADSIEICSILIEKGLSKFSTSFGGHAAWSRIWSSPMSILWKISKQYLFVCLLQLVCFPLNQMQRDFPNSWICCAFCIVIYGEQLRV